MASSLSHSLRAVSGNPGQASQGQITSNAAETPPSQTVNNASQESQNAPGRLLSGKADGRSLREKFNVDAHTGGVSLSIPIQTSPGRSGFGPSLNLAYSSGSASNNGIFGLGWSLSGVDSLSRKTSVMIPIYDDDQDTFVHSSVGDLVPVVDADSGKPIERDDELDGVSYRVRIYRPRVESDPCRVERWVALNDSEKAHWKTMSSGGVTAIFGKDDQSQISSLRGNDDSGEAKLVFAWLVSELYDRNGNHMVFSYKSESPDDLAASFGDNMRVYEDHRNATAQRYLKSIKYGNKTPNRDLRDWTKILSPPPNDPWYWMFEVVFDYGEHPEESPTTKEDASGWVLRPDPFSSYNSGFEIRTYRRCQRVLMFHHFQELKSQDCLVAGTELNYDVDPKSGGSVLRSCVPCGYQWDESGNSLSCLRLPAAKFEYWTAPDINHLQVEELELNLAGLSTPMVQWVDLNGDGAPGILAHGPGVGWYYHQNDSCGAPGFTGSQLVSPIPNLADTDDWAFEDMSGDGHLDVVVVSSKNQIRGFYEHKDGEEWADFVPFSSFPNVDIATDPAIHKVDLSGDGHADLLRLQYPELIWYPSLGHEGYGAEHRTRGAPIPSGESNLTVLCDMVGDGLSDIVSISNSSVRYWPNMGHGRFGRQIVMGNAPVFADGVSFSPQRIRMADITGTGTTDLIYLPPEGGVHVYYNQSGNCWSGAHVMDAFPALDRSCAIDVLDIGARGTQCLCWTSDLLSGGPGLTTVRFFDLMGGCKPGLLKTCSNGIGGQMEMTYRSSTQYYMEDQRAGKNWKRRLPFPIHCVERVITRDSIAQTAYTMRYAYHNGYYDPVERHFRGFQMVEEWDAEDLAASKAPLMKFQRPPVHTKTWYYLGLQQMDDTATLPEYYHTDQPQQMPLPAATIHGKASTEQYKLKVADVQDAYRALSGQKRRQEVFGADGSSKSSVPYVVSQQTYDVVMHQGIAQGQRYGIFRVQDREELTCSYERDVSEALVHQSFTLQTDDYGNIRKQVVVSYGKLESKLGKDEDRRKQQETIISYTESDYTNAIAAASSAASKHSDYFQVPLPSEVRQYRVLPGSEWVCNSPNRYTWETLNASLPGIKVAPIHEDPTGGSDKGLAVLISRNRNLYSKADLTGPLLLHELEPFSINYQSYQLAFTNKLLEAVLRDGESLLINSGNLAEELSTGGYVQLPKLDGQNDEWWAPSSRKLFKQSIDDDSPRSSLDVARSHFYVSNAEISQFGYVSHQEMDRYQLLAVKFIDAVKNMTLFDNDYVHLKPSMITDANGNRAQTVFDPFGRPLGIAVLGKRTEALGDSLDGFLVIPSQRQLEQFLNDPSGPIAAELLGNAGRRILYYDQLQQGSGQDHEKKPSFQAELVRDNHYKDDTGKSVSSQIFVSFVYFDGHGEAIQEVSLSGSEKDTEKWRLTGWALRDNKGQEVKQFLPSTAATHRFRPRADSSSSPATTLLRDPLDRVIAVLNADHTWTKTRFTSWMQVDYNAGDTVKIDDPAADADVGKYFTMLDRDLYQPTWYNSPETSREAASKSEVYQNTPTTSHADPLGRQIVVESDNGPHANSTSRDVRVSRKDYDLRGNVTQLRDALDRVVAVTRYDLLGHPLRRISIDSGSAWNLPNCLGSPFLSWTSRGIRHHNSYDGVGRVESVKVRLSLSAPEITVVKNIYGEGRSDSLTNNLNGKLYQTYDQSGLQTNNRFDFHGNCIESSVKYAVEYKQTLDWSSETNNMLEDAEYKTKTLFNAIGLVVYMEDSGGESIRHTYDVAGHLKTLKSFAKDGQTITSSVDNVSYDEDGKITSIDYGNGSRTTHQYDPKTRRLVRTVTTRTSDRAALEDISYLYDCIGKIIKKTNSAEKTIYFNNDVVSPTQEYRYNALGQLVEATGREQVDASGGGQKRLRPYDATSSSSNRIPGDGRQMVEYIETYEYDLGENIVKMKHAPRTEGGYSGWTRVYAYDEPSCVDTTVKSNRLSSTSIGSVTETYQYDDDAGRNGCMTSIPGYSALSWDHNDKLRSFSTQKVSKEGATPETTWYIYNSRGERTRKVTDGASMGVSTVVRVKDTRYLTMKDIFTTYHGNGYTVSNQITTTTISDSSISGTPIAMLEHNANSEENVVRYQISQNLELDETAQVLSYEEYSPYGSSTYQARNKGIPRKYRFMSYEKDRESGLYACGARYYAPWLGRWTSPDPIGPEDGLNLYVYVGNDPVNLDDQRGTFRTPRKRPATTALEDPPPPKRPRTDGQQRASNNPAGSQPTFHGISSHLVGQNISNRPNLDDQPGPSSSRPQGQAAGNEASTSSSQAARSLERRTFVDFLDKKNRPTMVIYFPSINGEEGVSGFMAHGEPGRLMTPETVPWDRNEAGVKMRAATEVANNIIRPTMGDVHGIPELKARREQKKPFYLFACHGAENYVRGDGTEMPNSSAGQFLANMIRRPVLAYRGPMEPKAFYKKSSPAMTYNRLEMKDGVDAVYYREKWERFEPVLKKK